MISKMYTIDEQSISMVCEIGRGSFAQVYKGNWFGTDVHLDIKPQNILISKIGLVAKICDFGLSKSKSQVVGFISLHPSPTHWNAILCDA